MNKCFDGGNCGEGGYCDRCPIQWHAKLNNLIEAVEDVIEAYELENNYGTSINNLKEIKQSVITKLAKATKEAKE